MASPERQRGGPPLRTRAEEPLGQAHLTQRGPAASRGSKTAPWTCRAVDHLVSLGHRDIVHIGGGRPRRRRPAPRLPYRHAPPRPALPDLARRAGRGERRRGRPRPAGRFIPARPPSWHSTTNTPPTSSTCSSAPAYPHPGQISVVGFDDSHLSRLAHINLTTVGHDILRLADLAVARGRRPPRRTEHARKRDCHRLPGRRR